MAALLFADPDPPPFWGMIWCVVAFVVGCALKQVRLENKVKLVHKVHINICTVY